MLYQKPEIKASLEVLISVFAVTALIFFAIRPTITNVFQLQKKIDDLESINTKADKKTNQLYAANKSLKDISNDLGLFLGAVPDEISFWDMAKRVEVLADQDNVKIDQLRLPGNIVSGSDAIAKINREKIKDMIKVNINGVTPIEISVSVSGTQSNLFNFIKDIESMDRLAKINTMMITKQAVNLRDNTPPLRADIKLVFYSYTTK